MGYKEPAFYRDGPSGGPPRDSYGREPAYKDGPASGAYKCVIVCMQNLYVGCAVGDVLEVAAVMASSVVWLCQ